jgi:putative ABC transport system permease protein
VKTLPSNQKPKWNGVMLKNYLKIAFRNLLKNKLYSIINVCGLAIGLACFILISTYIKNELNYDTFHDNADRIYRPYGVHERPGIGVQRNAVTPGPLGPALENDFAQVVSAARVRPMFSMFCKVGDKGLYEQNGAYADPSIFEIFTIPLVAGDPVTALIDPNSLVINEELANWFFGNENPLGKSISLHHSAGTDDYIVKGVMRDYPENSHLRISMLGSISTAEDHFSYINSWNSNSLATYVMLEEGASVAELEAQFPDFLSRNTSQTSGTNIGLHLQPLKEIHLKSDHLVYQTYNYNRGSTQMFTCSPQLRCSFY